MNENLKKYNNAFKNTFNVDEAELPTLKLKGSETWDSVGHIALISALEEVFEIDLETDDIFALSSYPEGLRILNEKYAIEF